MPMMRFIHTSSGFMMPEGNLTMPQTITTMHNPSYLALSSVSNTKTVDNCLFTLSIFVIQMPRDHSQGVSLCNKLSHSQTRLPRQATQQLSHLNHQASLVGVAMSAATSMASAIPAPTQLPPPTIQGWGNHSGCSSQGMSNNIWTPR